MADFTKAIGVILEHEGGARYTNISGDSGGPTRYGITLKTLSTWRAHPVSAEDVRIMSESEARDIYRARYWDRCLCGQIGNQTVATKVMDIAVNFGAMRAGDDVGEIVQRAVAKCGHAVRMDGWIGPKTIEAVNECDPDALLDALCDIQRAEYLEIANRDQRKAKFLVGWLARSAWPTRKTT